MEAQLDELLDFFLDPKPEVRQLATQHLFDFSGTKTLKEETFSNYFQSRASRVVEQCVKVILNDWHDFPISGHNAISALTNLVTIEKLAYEILNYPEFLPRLVKIITIPTTVLADPICMLLSNLSKHEKLAIEILKIPDGPEDLTDIFVKGSQKTFNKHAEFHFLASVFANFSMFPFARSYFLEKSKRDGLLPITRLMVFTEHPNIIRRGGVISAIKNCSFDTKYHLTLLEEGSESDLLPYLLLPLCGPEQFDDDDSEGMPDELQLLPDTKRREIDSKLRLYLIEALVLLTTTYPARQILKKRKVYPVIRELHKYEGTFDPPPQKTMDAIDDLVNMLERDEAGIDLEPINELDQKRLKPQEDEDDMAIEEII